jgi:S-adenosyl-L-methionine hydrolase (adenosine-forming)
MAGARPITFLSDYGPADEFAGVCRAVIAQIAPGARVIDLAHGIPGYDVGHGAAMLARSLPYAPPGIHLAVVDPGVGSTRRAVAVRVADGDRILVGPDNGLLSLALERLGGPEEAVDVSASAVRLEPLSVTFHGRDLFAPVAAHLALGTPLTELGERIDPAGLAGLERPAAVIEPGMKLTATVSHLDGYGNASLIATAEDAASAGLEPGGGIRVRAGGAEHDGVYGRTFVDVDRGELLLYRGSSGELALAVNLGDAGSLLGVVAGDELELVRA